MSYCLAIRRADEKDWTKLVGTVGDEEFPSFGIIESREEAEVAAARLQAQADGTSGFPGVEAARVYVRVVEYLG